MERQSSGAAAPARQRLRGIERCTGNAIGRTDQREQPDVNEIDIGHAERELPGHHDALVQHVIDHIEQRHVDIVESEPCRSLGRRNARAA